MDNNNLEITKDNVLKNVNLNEAMSFPEGGIFSRVLAKSKTYNYTLMCMAKGSNIDTHTSTKVGVVYIIKGKGTFRLHEEDIEMKAGETIFMPRDAPHSLDAKEDTALLLCLSE